MGSGPAFFSARCAWIALDGVDAERFEFADQVPERALVVEPLLVLSVRPGPVGCGECVSPACVQLPVGECQLCARVDILDQPTVAVS
jgi:hypothetical protein